jgi:starch-binding outer membrane protein, SusD/RagB family
MKNIIFLTLLFFTGIQSCKMEYTDPGGLTPAQASSTPLALTSVAVGLQRYYSLGQQSPLYSTITANGFTTNELILRNQGNLPELQLSQGGSNVDNSNSIMSNIWVYTNKIRLDADTIIAGASKLTDKPYASGLIGYASIFKALSLGLQAQYWASLVDVRGTLTKGATFMSREEGLRRAISVINSAQSTIAGNPVSTLFLSRIPAASSTTSGVDISNTLAALKARYSLFLGKYDDALAAANSVNITPAANFIARSTFNYEAANPNPIFAVATATNNVYQVADFTLGLSGELAPNPADKRLAFYTAPAPINTDTKQVIDPPFRIRGFANATATAFPVYLPGEITLIKAECYARNNDLANAVTELNKILTKKAAGDPFGVAADLPPYAGPLTQDAILTEIYKNRCIELYMSGLKLEDSRRFNRPQIERKRNFFPFPVAERDNNPNTPADPGF